MTNYLQTLGLFNRNVRLYLVTAAIIGFSYYGFFLVLFNLYLLRLGYGPRFIGIINATGPLAFILLSFPAGGLGRRWGSRRTIIAGISLYLVGFSLLPLAEFVPATWQTGWLLITYLIAFMGGPLYWVNSSIFMMSSTGEIERNHVFSVRTAVLPLAGFLGSLAAGLFITQFAEVRELSPQDPAPYRNGLWLGAALYLIALLAMFLTEEKSAGGQAKAAINWKGIPLAIILPIMLVEMLRMAGEVGSQVFFNVYLDDGLGVPTAQISVIIAVSFLLAGAAALAMPLLARRWGQSRTIFWSILGMVILLLLLALIPHVIMAALGFIGLMALANISRSTLLVYRMEIVLPIWWAAMSSSAVTAHGIGESAILLGGGYLIDTSGYTAFFLTTAGITLVAALLFGIFFLLPGRQTVSETVRAAE